MPEKSIQIVEGRFYRAMHFLDCGVKLSSLHDHPRYRWCIEIVGLHENGFQYDGERFYGKTLEDAISALDHALLIVKQQREAV